MKHYFKNNEEIDVKTLPFEKYEWERDIAAKKMADVIVETKNPEMVQKILNNEVDVVTITCYGTTSKMERKEALAFYLECMMCSEGSEQSRYVAIYSGLEMGAKVVSDEDDI